MKVFLFLLLLALFPSASLFAAGETEPARFSGTLATVDGRSVSGGTIYFFDYATGPAPIIQRYWRVPDSIAELDENGHFDLALPSGKYSFTYIKHTKPHNSGPPAAGDIVLFNQDAKGQPITYQLKSGAAVDIGKVAAAVPFDTSMAHKTGADITAISGKIIGTDDKPIADAVVLAFLTPKTTKRPLFTSEVSGRDGSFLLRVDKGGTYYLKVRGKHGGGKPGYDSVLDGEKDEALFDVSVKTGETAHGVIHKELTQRGPKSKKKADIYGNSKRAADENPNIVEEK